MPPPLPGDTIYSVSIEYSVSKGIGGVTGVVLYLSTDRYTFLMKGIST